MEESSFGCCKRFFRLDFFHFYSHFFSLILFTFDIQNVLNEIMTIKKRKYFYKLEKLKWP